MIFLFARRTFSHSFFFSFSSQRLSSNVLAFAMCSSNFFLILLSQHCYSSSSIIIRAYISSAPHNTIHPTSYPSIIPVVLIYPPDLILHTFIFHPMLSQMGGFCYRWSVGVGPGLYHLCIILTSFGQRKCKTNPVGTSTAKFRRRRSSSSSMTEVRNNNRASNIQYSIITNSPYVHEFWLGRAVRCLFRGFDFGGRRLGFFFPQSRQPRLIRGAEGPDCIFFFSTGQRSSVFSRSGQYL